MADSSSSGPRSTSETILPLIEARERFLAYLIGKVGDPELAEDLLQESLLKALRSSPNLRDEEQLIPWFFAILGNAVIDVYRKRGRDPGIADIELATSLPDTSEEQRKTCACFEALLPALKPEYAELIAALDLGNETAEHARRRLGISATNLKVRHHRARQGLRRRLEETCRVCAEHHCVDCTCDRAPRSRV
jgi:RNA polymerase sigma factor (sigma-70 family)